MIWMVMNENRWIKGMLFLISNGYTNHHQSRVLFVLFYVYVSTYLFMSSRGHTIIVNTVNFRDVVFLICKLWKEEETSFETDSGLPCLIPFFSKKENDSCSSFYLTCICSLKHQGFRTALNYFPTFWNWCVSVVGTSLDVCCFFFSLFYYFLSSHIYL